MQENQNPLVPKYSQNNRCSNLFQELIKDLMSNISPLSSRSMPHPEEQELLEEIVMMPDFFRRHPDLDGRDDGYVDGFRRFGGSQGMAYLHRQRQMGHFF